MSDRSGTTSTSLLDQLRAAWDRMRGKTQDSSLDNDPSPAAAGSAGDPSYPVSPTSPGDDPVPGSPSSGDDYPSR
jgi:hypothetical protein